MQTTKAKPSLIQWEHKAKHKAAVSCSSSDNEEYKVNFALLESNIEEIDSQIVSLEAKLNKVELVLAAPVQHLSVNHVELTVDPVVFSNLSVASKISYSLNHSDPLISVNNSPSSLVDFIYSQNNIILQKSTIPIYNHHIKSSVSHFTDYSQTDWYKENTANFYSTRPHLISRLKRHSFQMALKSQSLTKSYKSYFDNWKQKSEKLSRKLAKLEKKRKPSKFLSPTQQSNTFRPSSRRGDVVRSEAELDLVLQMLANQNKEFDSSRIANFVDMIIDPLDKQLIFYKNTNFIVNDADSQLKEYNLLFNNKWQESDKSSFLKLYLIHGKKFDLIANEMIGKNTGDVIEYYYREKHNIGTKNLVRNAMILNRGRKRGPKKRVGIDEKKHNFVWTGIEKVSLLKMFEKFGLDFVKISDQVGKSLENVEAFYEKYRKKLSIDEICNQKSGINKLTLDSPIDTLEFNSRRTVSYWSVAEKDKFVDALIKCGRNWEDITRLIPTKSSIQIRNYFYNFRAKLQFDKILKEHGHVEKQDEKPVFTPFQQEYRPPLIRQLQYPSYYESNIQPDRFYRPSMVMRPIVYQDSFLPPFRNIDPRGHAVLPPLKSIFEEFNGRDDLDVEVEDPRGNLEEESATAKSVFEDVQDDMDVEVEDTHVEKEDEKDVEMDLEVVDSEAMDIEQVEKEGDDHDSPILNIL